MPLAIVNAITIDDIEDLQNIIEPGLARGIRTEQNWVGGSGYSPLRADFVPPPESEVRRLLDSVLVSRDADPMLFALWFTALAMTPPMIVAAPKIVQYSFLQRAPDAMVLQIATAERSFFVLYGMLATALLAALTWDGLFPDRTDQEIVGALPCVRGLWPLRDSPRR